MQCTTHTHPQTTTMRKRSKKKKSLKNHSPTASSLLKNIVKCKFFKIEIKKKEESEKFLYAYETMACARTQTDDAMQCEQKVFTFQSVNGKVFEHEKREENKCFRFWFCSTPVDTHTHTRTPIHPLASAPSG